VGIIANLSDVAANAEANAIAALLNNGVIEFYSGTQPATANTAIAGNVLLGELTFGSPAFGAASGGIIAANPIASGTAVATATATFARLYESNGTTVVMDVVVGTSGQGINLNTTSIVTGGLLSLVSWQHNVVET